jgi:RHS repeat-associated protein
LTDVATQKGGTLLARFVSTLDPVGNPLSTVRTGSVAETRTYGYDANDRLVSVCFQVGACPGAGDPFVRWTYDNVGNRLSEQRPGSSTSYVYDARDRLLSAGDTSYAYDENGNEVAAGSRTFAYDLENRLKSTVQGGTTTTYAYDGDGVRVRASTGSKANRTTSFLWDLNGALPQIASERDGNGKLSRRYVYGVRRISQTAGNSTSYFAYDGLGSVVNLTSATGGTQWSWSYEPFGVVRSETKAQGNQPASTMRFAGEYLDPTGLYHLRARQYDPVVGRFLRPDPAGQSSNESVISGYAYAADRPTVMVDPSGEIFRPATLAAFFASFAASITDPDSPEVRCLAVECGARPASSLKPTPALVHPIPAGPAYSICQGLHRTSGLAGYWAIDFCARANTAILAVESGVLVDWSGHDPMATNPANRQLARAGIFGWSLYLRGKSGTRYFYTHLGSRLSRPGSGQRSVRVGQKIGTVGRWIGGYRPNHLHLGATGGTRAIERVIRAPRVKAG